MPQFHAGQGYSFERLDDGSVKVRAPEHDQRTELPEVVFDASTWASVVASVTPTGDNAATFGFAEQLHAKGDQAFPGHAPGASVAEIVAASG